MKKNFRIIFCLAAFSAAVFVSCNDDNEEPVVQVNCLPDNLQDGLVAAYTFGAGSLTDAVGNADLTLTGGVQLGVDRDGNTECAYTFDGQETSYLSTQNTAFLNGLDEMSISFWYKPNVAVEEFQTLVSRGDTPHCPDTHGEWSVSLYDCYKAVFGHGNSVWDNDITQFNCQEEQELRMASWHYVTATYNHVNNEIKIYRNGVLQNTATGVADCGGVPITSADVGDLFIGKGFAGTIDDIAIYNKVLTQTEIEALFAVDACCE